MTKELAEGAKAPEFNLPASTSEKIKLSDLKGKWVVLYFYPKDDTPGCTKEACSFRDTQATFKKKNAVVLGVSKDDLKSHDKFINKFSLNFPLLSDTDGKVCEAYGAWKEKSMYGKKYMGIERSTFLINPEGKLAKIWRKVSVDGHEAEIIKEIS